MNKAILGKKLGMTQVFTETGIVVPVTVVEAGPCVVTQKKTIEKDGYNAIQVAFGEIKANKLNKPQQGIFKKAGIDAKRYLKELRLDDVSSYEVGSVINCSIFTEGEKVDVTGRSKGHGFAGVIKRYGSARIRMSHGAGPCHRFTGSLGASSTPAKVLKGKKMPGRYGNYVTTIQNLDVVKVDETRNIILVKGALPGAKGSLVCLKNTVKVAR